MRSLNVLSMLLILPLSSTAAQTRPAESWPLDSGARIRLEAPELGLKEQTAVFLKATPDTLVFRQAGASQPNSIGMNTVRRIDVSGGVHTHKARGALLGFASGAAIAAAVVAATWKQPTNCGLCIDFGRGGDAAMGGMLGGLVGGVLGLAIGAVPVERWINLPLSGLRRD